MIRFARALAWLRWRLAVHAVRGGRRRDALEGFSRALALAVPAAYLALVAGGALLLGALGVSGGWSAGRGLADPSAVLAGPRVLLLAALFCMLLIPWGGASLTGHPRFLLMPVRREALHGLEVLASIGGPLIGGLLPGLALLAVGILLAGRPGPAAVALAAAAGMVAFMAALSAGLASFSGWILGNRKRSEVVAIVAVLVFCLFSVLPATMADSFVIKVRVDGSLGARIAELDRGLPAWSRALPSELYGRSIWMALDGRAAAAWLGVVALIGEAAAMYALSSWAHRKLLESSETGRSRRGTRPLPARAMRLPGLSPAVSAVALAQARTALRSVRGRLAILVPGPVIALLGVVSQRAPAEVPGGAYLAAHGHALFTVGVVFSMYSQLAFTMNQFASDRAGLTLQMLAPIRDVDLVRGKAVGCALVLTVSVAICLVLALAVCPHGSPLAWGAALLGVAATYLWVSPIAAFVSAVLPVASDLRKIGSGGHPHGLAVLLGTLLVLALSCVPLLIIGVFEGRMERPGLALGLVAAWTAAAAVLAAPLLALAAGAVSSRRENLLLVARGR